MGSVCLGLTVFFVAWAWMFPIGIIAFQGNNYILEYTYRTYVVEIFYSSSQPETWRVLSSIRLRVSLAYLTLPINLYPQFSITTPYSLKQIDYCQGNIYRGDVLKFFNSQILSLVETYAWSSLFGGYHGS